MTPTEKLLLEWRNNGIPIPETPKGFTHVSWLLAFPLVGDEMVPVFPEVVTARDVVARARERIVWERKMRLLGHV